MHDNSPSPQWAREQAVSVHMQSVGVLAVKNRSVQLMLLVIKLKIGCDPISQCGHGVVPPPPVTKHYRAPVECCTSYMLWAGRSSVSTKSHSRSKTFLGEI